MRLDKSDQRDGTTIKQTFQEARGRGGWLKKEKVFSPVHSLYSTFIVTRTDIFGAGIVKLSIFSLLRFLIFCIISVPELYWIVYEYICIWYWYYSKRIHLYVILMLSLFLCYISLYTLYLYVVYRSCGIYCGSHKIIFSFFFNYTCPHNSNISFFYANVSPILYFIDESRYW